MNRVWALLRRRRILVSLSAALAVTSLLLIIGIIHADQHFVFTQVLPQKGSPTTAQNKPPSLTPRKLLNLAPPTGKAKGHGKGASAAAVEPNRIWSEPCSKSDIVISQGATEPLPNGIPTYTVEIMNMSPTGCDISSIHLSCGWFSSARLVNPRVFKRLHFDDCLVNDGKPLANGRTLSFQYANTFPFHLSVSSINC